MHGQHWRHDEMHHEELIASGYEYCSDNLINKFDLNGETDDLFSDDAGNVRWDNSKESNIQKDGKTWNNVGNTLTIVAESFIDKRNDIPIRGVDGRKLTTE